MTVFSTTVDWERSFILASALGTMRRQLEESVEYARTHRRFGHPIGKNQSVANRIVDMRVRLDAARLLLYHVAWLKDRGRRTMLESAIVKLFLSEAFVESSVAAFETLGAQAYIAGTAAGARSARLPGEPDLLRDVRYPAPPHRPPARSVVIMNELSSHD